MVCRRAFRKPEISSVICSGVTVGPAGVAAGAGAAAVTVVVVVVAEVVLDLKRPVAGSFSLADRPLPGPFFDFFAMRYWLLSIFCFLFFFFQIRYQQIYVYLTLPRN
jgi:hypothetical protein